MGFNPLDRVAGRVSRRRVLGGASLATVGAFVTSRFGGHEIEAAPAAGGAKLVGVGKFGSNAIEFIGHLKQATLDFEFVGYVTLLNLLNPTALYTNSDPLKHTEKNARFTIVANLTGFTRSVVDTLFDVDAAGDIRFFYNPEGGSTFDDPGTFSHGDVVASGRISVQNTVEATAPKEGSAHGWGQITLTSVTPFKIGGKQYQLGAKGLHYRISFRGPGELTDPKAPVADITLAGNAVVARG